MTRLAPGQTVAGFRLKKLLGSGGFGEVWEATNADNHVLALKFIPIDAPGSPIRNVLRELEGVMAIVRMDHPNLLRIRRGPESDQFLIVVMELADETLLDRFDAYREKNQEGIPRKELLTYFEQAAAGIDFLNKQNVLHHDIKPENLLLIGGKVKFGTCSTHTLAGSTTITPGTNPAMRVK